MALTEETELLNPNKKFYTLSDMVTISIKRWQLSDSKSSKKAIRETIYRDLKDQGVWEQDIRYPKGKRAVHYFDSATTSETLFVRLDNYFKNSKMRSAKKPEPQPADTLDENGNINIIGMTVKEFRKNIAIRRNDLYRCMILFKGCKSSDFHRPTIIINYCSHGKVISKSAISAFDVNLTLYDDMYICGDLGGVSMVHNYHIAVCDSKDAVFAENTMLKALKNKKEKKHEE